MSIMEALKIVSDNAHGIQHNFWDVYLPAVIMVNEAFPVTGYITVEEDNGHELDYFEYKQDTNRAYDERNAR